MEGTGASAVREAPPHSYLGGAALAGASCDAVDVSAADLPPLRRLSPCRYWRRGRPCCTAGDGAVPAAAAAVHPRSGLEEAGGWLGRRLQNSPYPRLQGWCCSQATPCH